MARTIIVPGEEKIFLQKKALTKEKMYGTIYRPLGPGGILSDRVSGVKHFFYIGK